MPVMPLPLLVSVMAYECPVNEIVESERQYCPQLQRLNQMAWRPPSPQPPPSMIEVVSTSADFDDDYVNGRVAVR